MRPPISYAQRYEDVFLLDAFAGQNSGFYIDVGSGHPVFDNVTFALYLKGWHGITVEPNPRLARLSRAIRPRDLHVEMLVGRKSGDAAFHLVEDFHGLSTMIADNARAALSHFGKASRTLTVPVTTLAVLCERAGRPIDILKIDVEGAEAEVIAGGDWSRFQPKIVVAEALAPYTLAPAWQAWEGTLLANGYSYARFDSLNRYYVHRSAGEIARRLRDSPEPCADVVQFRNFKPALEDDAHPDHALALRLRSPTMADLPLLDADTLIALLLRSEADRPATAKDRKAAYALLSTMPPAESASVPDETIRSLYTELIASDAFRAALGRISASHTW
jgi:FkbM family methyltransferase